MNDDRFKENFVHTSTWAVYQYSSRDITILTRKTACFLLDYFSDIYTRINYEKLQFSILLQVATESLSKKRKIDAKNSFSILAMKMKDAHLCYLSLGYSSFCKPNLFGYDSSNCFNTNIIITEKTG